MGDYIRYEPYAKHYHCDPDTEHAATLIACAYAADTDEARLFLAILGLSR
jgi:hypothetical protein